MNRLFHIFWTQLWLTGVVTLVLLALYTSLGRQLVPLVETYKTDVELLLTEQLDVPVTVESLVGGWQWFSPTITVNNLVLGEGTQTLKVQNLSAELDVSASLFFRTAVFKHIDLTGVRLPFSVDANNRWSLAGFELETSGKKSKEKPLWLELLAKQKELRLYGWHLTLDQEGHAQKQVSLLDVRLRSQGDQHWLDGKVQIGGIDDAIVSVQVESEGDLWNLDEQQAKGYVNLPSRSWLNWLPDLNDQWRIDKLDAGLSLWFDIRDGKLFSLDGSLDVPEADVKQLDVDSVSRSIAFTEGKIDLAGRIDDGDWHIWFSPKATWQSDTAPPLPHGRISWLPNIANGSWQFQLKEVDLAQTSFWIEDFNLLPQRYMKYLVNLQPRGIAETVNINWLRAEKSKISVVTDVSEVGINAWNGIPASDNVSARVELTADKGRAVIKPQPGNLFFPSLYDQGWSFDRIAMTGYWSLKKEYLHIVAPDVKAEYLGSDISGGFSLYTPLNNSELEPQLFLQLGLENAGVSFHDAFIPPRAVPGLSSWLDENLHRGIAKQGMFIFSGSVESDAALNSNSLQLYLDMQDAEISYLPGWPKVNNIKGRLLVDSPQVDIWINKADTLGGSLVPNSGRIKVRNNSAGGQLIVNGKLAGDASEAIKYLQQTPLEQQMNGAFNNWHANGNLLSELYVDIPLSSTEQEKAKTRLQVDFTDNQIELSDVRLDFQQVNGRLIYDSEIGLMSEKMTAKTFAGDVDATIASHAVGKDFDIQILAQGRAEVAAVKAWSPLFLMDPVTGYFNYNLDFWAKPPERGGLDITIQSDLFGVNIDTPQPFGKLAESKQSFQFNVQKNRDLRLGFQYGELANGVLALNDGKLERGQIYLGSAKAFLPSDDGLTIKGRIAGNVDGKAWWDLWQDIKPENTEQESNNDSPLKHIDVAMTNVDAWGQIMGPTQVVGDFRWGEWLLNVDSDLMKGKVILPAAAQPLMMDLEYIHMPVTDHGGEQFAFGDIDAPDPLQEFDPLWIPDMDMKVAEVYLGTRNFGRWDMTFRRQQDVTEIDIKDSDAKAMQIVGKVLWKKLDGQHSTELVGMRMTSKRFGDVQRALNQAAAVEAKKAKFDVDMSWLGSPAKFNYASLNGESRVVIKDGVLINDEAGALKAFGILNFDSISRRLQLDFSDLYESGVAFDIMKTKLTIDDGLMTFAEPMWIDGPSAKFQTTGTVNLVSQEVDQKLVVTFPITSSLPLVAVLAGLAPQVAGAIYVTEKLIGEDLEQFTSASYSVGGTISEPVLTIDQAFDNELEGQESRSFKDRFLDIFGLGDD